jgi:hypothetical protein
MHAAHPHRCHHVSDLVAFARLHSMLWLMRCPHAFMGRCLSAYCAYWRVCTWRVCLGSGMSPPPFMDVMWSVGTAANHCFIALQQPACTNKPAELISSVTNREYLVWLLVELYAAVFVRLCVQHCASRCSMHFVCSEQASACVLQPWVSLACYMQGTYTGLRDACSRHYVSEWFAGNQSAWSAPPLVQCLPCSGTGVVVCQWALTCSGSGKLSLQVGHEVAQSRHAGALCHAVSVFALCC